MEEEFQVVKGKAKKIGAAPVEEPRAEYMMLSEEEILQQNNRMNWRKGAATSVGELFRVQNERPDFPTAFQNYRPAPEVKKQTPFSSMKQKIAKKETLKIQVPDSAVAQEPPYAEKTP